EELSDTAAGKFLNGLSDNSSVDALDILIGKLEEASETVDELRDQETRLRRSDTSVERQILAREAQKLDALGAHIGIVHATLASDSRKALEEQRDQILVLEEAANIHARTFASEPLPGVGTSPWKELWDSAKRFSEQYAYHGHEFPDVDDDSRCVLCQQSLDEDGRSRLLRFDQFVRDDTQIRLKQARSAYEIQKATFVQLDVLPEAVENFQKDLESSQAELIARTRALLGTYENILARTREALEGTGRIPPFDIEPTSALTQLSEASNAVRRVAEELSDPEIVRQRLTAVTRKRQELELLYEIKNSRHDIINEINRLRERKALEAIKTAAATTSITKKVMELSEESITEVVRDTFTRETERVGLDRVTIARTRARKGALLHQPKLVGARQDVTLPRVFSEGEQTALGLAAYFTEASLDASRSGLILDDPVNSLDHVRRGLVADRLAGFAENRQVVIFTHDIAFVADLKQAAYAKGVETAERSVTRSRAGERKPGACYTRHPWKARDVTGRIGELRATLAQMKRDSRNWDDTEYENNVAVWAGNLSETWERIFSQEIVGPVLAEGGLEVRPMMVKVLARFTEEDHREFERSYSRVSQWAKRHDKSAMVNYVAPDASELEGELERVNVWFKRVKGYRN
ncbi:MAG: AAA family ATPase, partial [Boseongicola sp.]|nr:AAA family ATPase [Boseongicola sp.]